MLGKTYQQVSDRNPRSRTRNHNRSNSRTLAEAAGLSAAAASEASSCPRACCGVAGFCFLADLTELKIHPHCSELRSF